MKLDLHVKIANQAYRNGDYYFALSEYNKAALRYGSKFFDYNIKKCEYEISLIKAQRRSDNNLQRKYGVSVIIPTYKGENTIGKCIQSLVNQELHKDLYEIIVVINGERDDTYSVLQNYKKDKSGLNLSILEADVKGVGNARNLGCSFSDREYITFIDDDDYVSSTYLGEMLKNASKNDIVFSQILDDENGRLKDNTINEQLRKFEKEENFKYNDISSIVTLNACKLVPYRFLNELNYDNNLKSGEDVVFWMRVLAKNTPKIKIVPFDSGCIYYRVLRNNSVSRRPESYDFNVTQRLAVIKELYSILPSTDNAEIKEFTMSKIRAQLGFCIAYLKKYEEEYEKFINDLSALKFDDYVYKYVNSKLAKEVVISYCFPPYVDTAGVVMAKRIWQFKKPVDVISNQMDKIRKQEPSLHKIAKNFIGDSTVLNAPAAFSNWNAIKIFSEQALVAIEKQQKSKGLYSGVYSRAMWPGSNFAAALYKTKYPNVKWVAEFSDPILFNINGVPRQDLMEVDWLRNSGIYDALIEKGFQVEDDGRLFYWCEYLPYALADELIFTNINQQKYMFEVFPSKHLIDKIEHKVKIIPQPSLTKEFYDMADVKYFLDSRKINIGYFGAFYEKRGLGEVFENFKSLPVGVRSKFKFHVFTEQHDQINKLSYIDDIKDMLQINSYLPYLEFLNLSKKMDCLFVNDTETLSSKIVNPYLPSKISDYLGSGSKIWASCELGSSMHQISKSGRIDYISILGDENSYKNVLELLVKLK